MNPIEQEVREMLRTKVAQAPVRDEPPPVVLRRTRTLRAVNAIGATAAAAAVVIGIVLGAQTFGDRKIEPDASGQPIPWIDRSAEHPGDAARPCEESDVDLTVGASPTRFLYFRPATAASVCSFTFDSSDIRFRDSDGQLMDLRINDPSPNVVDIGGGKGGHTIPYGWSNYCGPETSRVQIEIPLSDGAGALRAAYATAPPGCVDRSRPSTIDIGLAGSVALPSAAFDPTYNEVTFTVKGPPTVRRNETLQYQVILTNGTDVDIPFGPCPIYNHGVADDSKSEPVGGAFYLNCEATPDVIPAGGRLVFEMQLAGFTTTGRKILIWGLQTMDPISIPIQIV